MDHSQSAAVMTGEDAASFEKWVLLYCRSHPEGVRQEMIQMAVSRDITVNRATLIDIALALNSLTSRGLINVFRQGTIITWKPVAEEEVKKLEGLDPQERLVYAAIEREGNLGIWIKDLRKRTNLFGQGVLEKILRTLVTRKLIKSEKSIAGMNKKVYMLYGLVPATEVTGGTWYKDHEMDLEFIRFLRYCTLAILQRFGPLPADSVLAKLKGVQGISVELKTADVELLLSTLFMDRKLITVHPRQIRDDTIRNEMIQRGKMRLQMKRDKILRRQTREQQRINKLKAEAEEKSNYNPYSSSSSSSSASSSSSSSNAVDDDISDDDSDDEEDKVYAFPEYNYANTSALVMPCIGCPLISKCYPGNLVEPATCLYMKEWLSMDMSNALTPTQEYSLLSSELATLHRARVTSTTDNTTTGTTTTMQ